MAIAMYFQPQAMSAAQYDEVIKRLDAAGHSKPKGRRHHCAFGPDDHLMVYDIWDSQEDFEAFGQILMPLLAEAGLESGQPDIMPVHNIIQ